MFPIRTGHPSAKRFPGGQREAIRRRSRKPYVAKATSRDGTNIYVPAMCAIPFWHHRQVPGAGVQNVSSCTGVTCGVGVLRSSEHLGLLRQRPRAGH